MQNIVSALGYFLLYLNNAIIFLVVSQTDLQRSHVRLGFLILWINIEGEQYQYVFLTNLFNFCWQHELSQSIQTLSEKAKIGSQFTQKVKAMIDKVEVWLEELSSLLLVVSFVRTQKTFELEYVNMVSWTGFEPEFQNFCPQICRQVSSQAKICQPTAGNAGGYVINPQSADTPCGVTLADR